ncbi:hypothetical protein ATY41_07695 [Leifsonia xyli subsp. xyli]|nr:hypothetical protein [Leifsonia xyli]ODA90937.1 hypothetical protein ATY41_07695 [Leifsonia xyli subsp. xyli]
MSSLMPELLATWSWRLERGRTGRTVLTRGQAATAKRDLEHDRSAHPGDYAAYEDELAAALDALEILSRQANRADDLLAVLAAERRQRGGAEGGDHARRTPGPGEPARARGPLTAEHEGIPAGLPELLDQWVHRLIRYRNGAKLIAPIEAARAEIRLRNEAHLHPGAYRNAVTRPYYGRVMRELGEIATAQRPGVRVGGRGMRRTLGDLW